MKKRRKKIIGAVLILEIIAISVILMMVLLKGDISFHTINAKEAASQQKQPEGNEDGLTNHTNGKDDSDPMVDQGQSELTEEDLTDSDTHPNQDTNETLEKGDNPSKSEEEHKIPEDIYDTITISAAGDVTLGRDLSYGYERSFDHEFELQNKDYGYFFKNVKKLFEEDDITVVNLETTLTNADKPAQKKFRFKADPSYVEILKKGDIEVVSIANNHTRDYLEKGYEDTLKTLKTAEVGYFGYEHTYIKDIRGIQVGFAGFTAWEATEAMKEKINRTIQSLRDEGADLVVLMFHWGIERDYYPNNVQQKIAHYSIDSGADLVLGSHPHVLQGIEEYKGKNIIYSLGNFSFGGNKNPSDKDTMIYRHKFHFKNGELVDQENDIIPCSISSVKERNNYQPTPLEGSEKERVLNKIEGYSKF